MDATNSNVSGPPKQSGTPLWLFIPILAVIAVALYLVTSIEPPARPIQGTSGPQVGRPLTKLQLQPLTGDARPITTSDLDGRVTLLNFWGTWCPPCVEEFPSIVALKREFAGDKSVQVLAVSCVGHDNDGLDELQESTQRFLTQRGLNMATFSDANFVSRQAMLTDTQAPQGMAYPTTLILDRQGIVRGFWRGIADENDMRDLIKQLLAET